MSAAPQVVAVARPQSLGKDFAELFKARVTSLVMMTAWCGCYMAAIKSGVSSLSLDSLHAVLGIGLVAGGTAALNEVIERDADALMLRTNRRPLPMKSMALWQALALGLAATIGGVAYLALASNMLTAALALATSAVYLGVYTPLKKVSPISTFLGAFPGAMPGLLGWTALRGKLEWQAFALFAVVWVWQFPHFHSIAWLYSEDYRRAGIRMLPVVDETGRKTVHQSIAYAALLIPVTLAPALFGMSGRVYLVGAFVLGVAQLWMATRLGRGRLAPADPHSKAAARQLLLATVLYLPALFALMMFDAVR
ncbi:MAG: protoheme IX farnesyltransferase [Candidatus Koribacter versatilis]|uniref:Protoheme IX farnesyltransferase n=1 Tax=Candidatus Korobacter versatilis TaxID=658062 RepID=A0A932A643_9BACT|nr:protoheme IX farnesyltransferase [Candidatus Koribacter versatilis]